MDLAAIGLILSAATFILSAVGTASTVLLGWRNDRRQSREFGLKIEQLEMQLANARGEAASRENPN